MQLIFLPKPLAILLCFFLWAVFQLAATWICIRLPDKYLDASRFPFRTFAWERGGAFYRLLLVHRWKKFLPDGGAIRGPEYRKKSLERISEAHLRWFLVESCRAEAGHFLAILPFWTFGFIGPPEVIWYMLAYSLAINIPCVLVQRYNRPRMMDVLARRYAQKET